MSDIFRFIELVIDAIMIGFDKINPITPMRREMYLRGLQGLITLATIPPLLMAIVGIATGWDWMTATAGLWCFLFLLALMVWGTPIGLVVDALLNFEVKKWFSVTRYAVFARGVLLCESLAFSLLALIPLREAWSVVPIFFLLVISVVLMAAHWKKETSWIKPILWNGGVAGVVICLTVFFWPLVHRSFDSWIAPQIWAKDEHVRLRFYVFIAGLAIILALLLIGWTIRGIARWFRGGASHDSHTTTAPATTVAASAHAPATSGGHGGGHGGHGGGGGISWWKLLGGTALALVLLGVGVTAYTQIQQSHQVASLSVGQVRPTSDLPRSYEIIVGATTRSEFAPEGVDLSWAEKTSGTILVSRNDEPEFESCMGSKTRMSNIRADRTYNFKAKDPNQPVRVRIYLSESLW